MSHEKLKEGATCGCAGTFYSIEASKNRVVEFRAIAAEVLRLSIENACTKSEESGAQIFVTGSVVQRGGWELEQRHGDSLVRQLLTSTSQSLIAVIVRSKVSGDGCDTDYLTILYFFEQPVLLNVSDELGDDDVQSAWQGAVLDGKVAQADGGDHTVRKRQGLSGGQRLIEHLGD